jgi:rhamnosyltransferase
MLLAVLVLYGDKLERTRTFSSLLGSASRWPRSVHLLVYDNSPVPMHLPDELYSLDEHIQYVSDTSNPGVSKAYNMARRIARHLGKNWLLLLDQDTVFPAGALLQYLKAIESPAGVPLLAPVLMCDGRIYSPCRNVLNANWPLGSIRPGTIRARAKSLLNSGMCIRLDAFERIGGFDENIPLDFADHDFMKRYRKHFDSFVLLDVTCAHGFSDKGAQDRSQALARFRFYCLGAKNSIKSTADALSLFVVALVRASRLSARFKDPAFVLLFFTTFFRS